MLLILLGKIQRNIKSSRGAAPEQNKSSHREFESAGQPSNPALPIQYFPNNTSSHPNSSSNSGSILSPT